MVFEEITLDYGGVRARIAPMRGSIITHLEIDDKPILYLDRETFEDPARSVRGGIPILFPFAGVLEDGRLRPRNTRISRHGFARERPWKVVSQNAVQLRTQLVLDSTLRSIYPFDFEIEQTCLLIPNGIQVELLVMNIGTGPMPIAPGWHPYFICPSEAKALVATDLPGFDPAALTLDGEFDFGVKAPPKGVSNYQVPGLGTIRLTMNPSLRHIQFWSQRDADFVCIEPWAGPNNAINTPAKIVAEPGKALLTWFRIEVM